jgi:hypothetical protein
MRGMWDIAIIVAVYTAWLSVPVVTFFATRRFNIFARLGLAVVSAVIGMIAISCIILAIAGDK